MKKVLLLSSLLTISLTANAATLTDSGSTSTGSQYCVHQYENTNEGAVLCGEHLLKVKSTGNLEQIDDISPLNLKDGKEVPITPELMKQFSYKDPTLYYTGRIRIRIHREAIGSLRELACKDKSGNIVFAGGDCNSGFCWIEGYPSYSHSNQNFYNLLGNPNYWGLSIKLRRGYGWQDNWTYLQVYAGYGALPDRWYNLKITLDYRYNPAGGDIWCRPISMKFFNVFYKGSYRFPENPEIFDPRKDIYFEYTDLYGNLYYCSLEDDKDCKGKPIDATKYLVKSYSGYYDSNGNPIFHFGISSPKSVTVTFDETFKLSYEHELPAKLGWINCIDSFGGSHHHCYEAWCDTALTYVEEGKEPLSITFTPENSDYDVRLEQFNNGKLRLVYKEWAEKLWGEKCTCNYDRCFCAPSNSSITYTAKYSYVFNIKYGTFDYGIVLYANGVPVDFKPETSFVAMDSSERTKITNFYSEVYKTCTTNSAPEYCSNMYVLFSNKDGKITVSVFDSRKNLTGTLKVDNTVVQKIEELKSTLADYLTSITTSTNSTN